MEQKWDGQRAIATTGGKHPALYSRNSNDISRSFPEIVNALTEILDDREVVLDGEIVALDDRGIPSFSRLQQRMHVHKPAPLLRTQVPVTYYVFDVLDVLDIDGTDIIDLPYIERREALSNLSLNHARIKVPPYWLNVDGPTVLDIARKHELEGIVAKSITSTYQPGKRSPAWLKTPLRANTEAVICGYEPCRV